MALRLSPRELIARRRGKLTRLFRHGFLLFTRTLFAVVDNLSKFKNKSKVESTIEISFSLCLWLIS